MKNTLALIRKKMARWAWLTLLYEEEKKHMPKSKGYSEELGTAAGLSEESRGIGLSKVGYMRKERTRWARLHKGGKWQIR